MEVEFLRKTFIKKTKTKQQRNKQTKPNKLYVIELLGALKLKDHFTEDFQGRKIQGMMIKPALSQRWVILSPK